jgi:hypothetical protein
MPQPRRATSTSARPGRNGNIPVGDMNEAEAASIRASVQRKEMAPSSQQQTFVDWRKLANQLGQPFEVERIPISKLRAMNRDPMLAFGMAFMETPHARAEWGIDAQDSNGPNHQVAGNVDWALRRIWTSYVQQFFLSLRYGSVALAKRFEERVPAGTYIDVDPNSGERTELPLWSEGGIAPIVWKPFVALPPETVEPIWNSDGEFDGIDYSPPEGSGAPGGAGATSNGKDGYKIPLSHALWITNEKENSFGNMYGYPRLGYAYRYWWSYWFRWAIADRAFERKGDPSIIVRHPDGDVYDPLTQTRREAGDVAMELGERMRSGGVITMPSSVYMGEVNGVPSAQPEWDISTLKDLLDFDPFDASFEYLDIMKLRSLWVPEQAFLEGKGGTSSRNVASEMSDAFMEQQEILMRALVEHINRWVIPQFIAINFPEFIAAGGTAKLVMKGFAPRDIEAMRQMVQLIAQQERGARELASIVDLPEMAKALGMPLRPFAEQQRIDTELKAEAEAARAPAAPAAPAGSGLSVVPTATGFAYVNEPERERVVLFSGEAAAFENGLRDIGSPAFEDRAVRGMARELWGIFNVTYRDEYNGFADWLETLDLTAVEAAQPGDSHWNRAKQLINDWNRRANALATITKAKKVIGRVLDYAEAEAVLRIGQGRRAPDEARNAAVDSRISESVTQIFSTTEDEVTRFLANQLEQGETDAKKIAQAAREHFGEFPVWKSDRATRNEVRNAYNEGVLIASEVNDATVQALDAMLGDTDDECKGRDGRLLNPQEARQQEEHPYGTLTFRALPAGFSVQHAEGDKPRASYDSESLTVRFEGDVSDETQRSYLKAVVDKIYA